MDQEKTIPSKVLLLKSLAHQNDFHHSCLDEVGHLLQVLTASIKKGVVAEIGTGYGVGASWIQSTLHEDVSFITIDNDLKKVQTVNKLITSSNIRISHGDWKDILKYGPFKLLFADGGKAKEQGAPLLFNSLDVGGMIVIDDLTPIEFWPDEGKDKRNNVREFWLKHPCMHSIELRVTPRHAVIIGTKLKNGTTIFEQEIMDYGNGNLGYHELINSTIFYEQ